MNYLAHLFLSGDEAEVMAGNFLADFLTLEEVNNLPENLYKGVELHRKIDTFTDNHTAVKELSAYLRDSQGKYAPVALDIIFDYLLSQNWDKYSEIEYPAFCQYVYIVLKRFINYVSERDREQIEKMIDSRWLSVYKSTSGLYKIMEGMDRRSRFPSHFYKAIKEVEDNYSLFNQKFNEFFPDMIEYVRQEYPE